MNPSSASGPHELIRAIVEEFVPRFLRKPRVLFRSDADMEVARRQATLESLGIEILPDSNGPDLLVHDAQRDWLFVFEAANSHEPIDQRRKDELTHLFASARPCLIFVTAFPNRESFSLCLAEIAWETTAWLADEPDHLIHYNGERLLGPYGGHSLQN